jgi:hypothetical protein
MKKILPLVLLLIGAGAGVGAGILLRPDPTVEEVDTTDHGEKKIAKKEHATNDEDHGEDKSHGDDGSHGEEKGDDHGGDDGGYEYAKLNNQFVVPIVAGEKVVALIVLALSIEVPNGRSETVYKREPKLRDSFLQVLFDHANVGGFEGNFTDAEVLGRLRESLYEVAQKDLGEDVALDVLIEEIARQDY